MLTLLQVMTLDSWMAGVARPVLHVRPWLFAVLLAFLCTTTFGPEQCCSTPPAPVLRNPLGEPRA